MSNFLQVIAFAVSLLTFQFFFWRRLHEDFDHRIIFRSGTLMVAGFAIGSVVSALAVPLLFPASKVFSYTGLWFWGAIVGVAAGFLISQRVFKLPFYEMLEASVVGFLFAIPFVTREFLYAIPSLIAYYILLNKYKSFSWYKSGRVGFAGLATLGIFFLVRSILALVGERMLVFTGIGKVEVVLCAAVAFLCFFGVYSLSEQ